VLDSINWNIVIFYLGISVRLANGSLPETASYYVRVTLVQN
jgi:hypothetical protein